jgi:hypothetical protein
LSQPDMEREMVSPRTGAYIPSGPFLSKKSSSKILPSSKEFWRKNSVTPWWRFLASYRSCNFVHLHRLLEPKQILAHRTTTGSTTWYAKTLLAFCSTTLY